MKRFILPVLRRLARDSKGATAILFAVTATSLVGMVGLSVDVGRVLAAKSAFTASVQSEALAGAYALLQYGATQTTVSTAVTNWNSAHAPSNVTTAQPATSLSCVTATTGLPSCTSTTPNVVSVTQTGTVSTHFLKAFGFSTFSLSATANAAKSGGGGTQPMNVMFVLDSTQSMNTADTGCPALPGIKSPTRYQCALYSIQSVLAVMQPTMASVGLMAFPGTQTQLVPSKPCPTSSKLPAVVPYYNSPIYYQIGSGTSLSTDYNNGSGTLTDTSMIVEAVGDYNASPSLTGCQTARGGEGTYIAEALTKAQAALPVVAGRKNVIILLSDGDAEATSAELSKHSTTAQCGAYVTAAKAASAAGTTVYTVAYGAPTSGCSSGDTYNPCSALMAAATTTSTFYSTNNTCQTTSSNYTGNLPSIFTQISISLALTKPRLL